MDNPFDSPETNSKEGALQQTSESTGGESEGGRHPHLISWGIVLVAAGTAGICLMLWLDLALECFDTRTSTDFLIAARPVLLVLAKVTDGALAVGCLLCVYVPSRLRVARYTVMAAGVQLMMLARMQEWLPGPRPTFVHIALESYLPTLILFGVFLYLLAKRTGRKRSENQLRRAGIVAAVAVGLSLFSSFAATAGDAIERSVGVHQFVVVMTQILLSLGCLYFFWQLIAIRSDLCRLTHEEDQLE